MADRTVQEFQAPRQRDRTMEQRATPDTCRVTVAGTGQEFACGRDELILDAALAAGLGLPHNCRGGACGTCKSEVLAGEVDHGWVMSFAISDEEKAAGRCLICQSKPLSAHLIIRPLLPIASADETPPPPIEASGSVVAAEPVTPSIRRLVIALPPGLRFRFLAGQHVEIRTEGVAKPRTYSIATAPDDDGSPPEGLLEFFISCHEGGRASGWLHAPERLGGPLTIHGPYGSFHLPGKADGPVLCLAGGSGLAPILSVARRALAAGFAHPMKLILSVRDRSEVFALDALHALARRHANFSHTVTLSRADAAGQATGWRSGRIASWLDREFPDLGAHRVLVAGAPGFVEACREKALALGARPEHIVVDSFTPTTG
jgi:CDP-4-dehydro-6-deoxyglucose reductase